MPDEPDPDPVPAEPAPKPYAYPRRPRFDPPERFVTESDVEYRSRAFAMELATTFKAWEPLQLTDIVDFGWTLDQALDFWGNLADFAVVYDYLSTTSEFREKHRVHGKAVLAAAPLRDEPRAAPEPEAKPRGPERQMGFW